ncbi:histidine phosphatase family protein [Rhodovulum sp. DZ06]|uniref:histidine phosphatase family protein n=1 Tax=Rhodovulum sp. DZ06 TaxID=3425126 RepID=UPI003D34103D
MRDPDDHHIAALRAAASGPGLTLFRHPKMDADGVVYGRSNPPFADVAARQIEDACRRALALRLSPPELVSSPAERALALAGPLSEALGVGVRVDHRLHELDFGAWEGTRWDALDRAVSDPWAADPWRLAPPGGESFGALAERVGAALADAAAGAVLVCHAGPIRAAWMLRQGLGMKDAFARAVEYAAPTPLPAREARGGGADGLGGA